MFYIVGENVDNYFVFDTEDNSCELVSMYELENSGIHAEKLCDRLDFTRLKICYNLEEDRGFWGRDIVSYTVPYIDGLEVGLMLSIFVVKVESFVYEMDKIVELNMHNKYGYMEKYAAVAGIAELDSNTYYRGFKLGSFQCGRMSLSLAEPKDFSISPVIRRIDVIRGGFKPIRSQFWGMIIPLRMFDYTIRLAQSQDLHGILRAYAGLFDKRLIINGVNIDTKYKKVDHIVWAGASKM